MTDEEKMSEEANQHVRAHKAEIVQKFAGDDRYPSVEEPISMFMAGSPGAGKTEFSRRFIEDMRRQGGVPIVRIDPDEIRNDIPGYVGQNAFLFQGACSIGVDKIHDYVLQRKKHFILDGTFSNGEKAHENIKRSIDRGRPTRIVYIYQDPVLAWKFTQARESVEGRRILKPDFIRQFFAAKENVNKAKEVFGASLRLWLIEKDFLSEAYGPFKQVQLNAERVDNYLDRTYTEDELNQLLT